jgi:glycosyltransferase involved in cell wall biosynthesis
MLKHFSEARIYIGISLSDGISTSLLEAMATGCYPIQTSTSCANEVLPVHGGTLVGLDQPKDLSIAVISALSDPIRIDQAAQDNYATISEYYSSLYINQVSKSFYDLSEQ